MSHPDENITPAALLEQLVYVDTFMPEIDDPSQLDERLTAELSAFADESFIFPDEEKPARDSFLGDGDNHHHTNNINDSNNNNNNNNNNDHDNNDNHGVKSHEKILQKFNEMNEKFANKQDKDVASKGFNPLTQSNHLNNGISDILSPLQNQNNAFALNQFTSTNGQGSGDLLNNLPKVPVPPGAKSSLIAAGLSQTQIDALAALIAQHQGGSGGGANGNSNDDSIRQSLEHHLEQHLGHSNGVNLISPSQSLLNPGSIPSSSSELLLDNNDGHGHGHGHGRNNSVSVTSDLGDASRSNSIKLEGGVSGDHVDLDKRKRNTAASARFRIKKKLKEQQLERNVRELNELTITLEKKIQTLEMENKLLRNLVVEKGEQKNNDELEYLKKKAKLSVLDTTNSTNFNNPNGNGSGPSSSNGFTSGF